MPETPSESISKGKKKLLVSPFSIGKKKETSISMSLSVDLSKEHTLFFGTAPIFSPNLS
jgi:hypothetical protein